MRARIKYCLTAHVLMITYILHSLQDINIEQVIKIPVQFRENLERKRRYSELNYKFFRKVSE